MGDAFPFDVFLSHSAKDKSIVRPLGKQLRVPTCHAAASVRSRNSGRFRFRDLLNQERRFLPLRLDPAPGTFTDTQDHRIKLNY